MTVPGSADAFEALLARRGPDLLVLVDDALRIVRAGREAALLAERPEERLIGMSLIAAFGSAPLDAVAWRALSSGAAQDGEAELGPRAPRTFTVDAVPLPRGGLVLALHDVTAVRRGERVRRDFVANISHELRTPLTSVKLLAETIASGSVDDAATTREFAMQIEREVDHLAQLVDELLDLSTIESGDTQLTTEPLDPEAVITTCVERIRAVADRREIDVTALPGPPDGAGVRALADPGRLGQALLNFAHNAVKFSHPGGSVRLGWIADDRHVRFTVADDGVGIAPAHQGRIFERFYKVDRSRARAGDEDEGGGSAGLGLAIVRHIAEAHGGRAGVVSQAAAGSTFWIEVPKAT
ncbi:MAG: PAS domain-containing sensor histidine kinase [Chloroflexi bacterium]|nr:PAS domain-containing sensor histidine kinase [Chloroflexota bacterium]